MKVVWMFFRMGLLRYDTVQLLVLVHETLVTRLGLLENEDMDRMEDVLRLSFGSAKWTLAFLVGQRLGGVLWISGLLLAVTLPSFLLVGMLLFYGLVFLSLQQQMSVAYGVMPVLAALFVVKAVDYMKQAKQHFSWISWIMFLVVALLLVVVLRLPVAVAMLGMFLFLVFFFRGGSRDD